MVRRVAQHNEQLQDLVQRGRGLLQGARQEQPPGKCCLCPAPHACTGSLPLMSLLESMAAALHGHPGCKCAQ